MTTIAIDENLTIASDSQASIDNRREQHPVQKIWDIAGFRVGIAGRYSEALAFISAFEDMLEAARVQQTTYLQIPESVMDELDNFNALVITPNGEVLMYEGSRFSMPIQAPCAIGSGSEYALAAMACGKTAEEAVEIAIKFDICSGGEIDSIPFIEDNESMPNREDWEKKTKKQILDEIFGQHNDTGQLPEQPSTE